MDYETRHSLIATRAWERWTDGVELDEDVLEQASKSARDAATNTYQDDITDTEWLDSTLRRLGVTNN